MERFLLLRRFRLEGGIELGSLGYGRRDRREYQKEDQDGLYKNKEAKRITQSTVKRIWNHSQYETEQVSKAWCLSIS